MSEETKVQESAEAEVISQDALDNFVSLKKGDIVNGTIVKIEDNQATVSLGYKYDDTDNDHYKRYEWNYHKTVL